MTSFIAKAHIREVESSLNAQHGRTTTDLHGTMEDLYNQKLRLEQALHKQKSKHDKEMKDAIDAKTLIHTESEVKMKQVKQALETQLKGVKEEVVRERATAKTSDERLKERTDGFEKRVKAAAKRIVIH